MNGIYIFPAGYSAAGSQACSYLSARGFQIVGDAAPDVTHLMLPVPSFESDGRIRGGGILEHILADLPEDITVVGGNLHHPALDGYHKLDLLQDADYVAKNAAITADCAIRLAGKELPVIWKDCRVLILGWGRIGKCLAAQLKAMEAKVIVSARKAADRAMIKALGMEGIDTAQPESELPHCRVIFNTIPQPVLTQEQTALCQPGCLLVDLASQAGIAGKNVIHARGLPGKDAPESSGMLIARTMIRMISGKEQPV